MKILIALPIAILFGLSSGMAFADEEDIQREIPSIQVTPDSMIDPMEAEPIDKSEVVITDATPTDQLASVMGPIFLVLVAIVVWLAIWTWSKAVDEIHPPEDG